jgi:hypothetical protein
MKSYLNAARTVLLVGGLALAAGCGSPATGRDAGNTAVSSTTVPMLPTATQALVDKSYARVAAANGDPNARPKWVVSSTLGPAVQTMSQGDGIGKDQDPSTPVFVAEGPGNFNWAGEKLPQGATPSTGRYLVVVLDTSDGGVMMWGPSDTTVAISSLGMLITPIR